MRAVEQYSHVVLFIMLCKVVLTITVSADEAQVFDYSKESNLEVL